MSTEKSHMNVETEPRTYYCDGVVAGGEQKDFWEWGGKKHFGGELAKRNLGNGVANFLRDEVAKHF